MRVFAADRAAVGLRHDDVEAAALVYSFVGLRHSAVADGESFLVCVEAVAVLHVEFAHSEESGARALLIPEFRLYLVEGAREVAVAVHIRLEDVGDDFFVGRRDDEAASASVLKVEHCFAHCFGSSGLFPEFQRLKGGHSEFLRACVFHLFADDLLDLAQRSPRQRQVGVHSGG